MINTFLKICHDRKDQTAMIERGKEVTFGQLLTDVHKMGNLLRHRIPDPERGTLLLVPPSYPFYVLLFACIYCGIPVVVMDSYRDLSRVRRTMEQNGITQVFCNRLTGLLRSQFPAGTHFVRVSDYSRWPDTAPSKNEDPAKTVLTTFTSGTTSEPKPIHRSIKSLQSQVTAVKDAIGVEETDVVYASLPIYALMVVYSGLPCVIGKNTNPAYLRRHGVNTVIAPLAQLLKTGQTLPFVKKLCFGGAVLYTRQAEVLLRRFPNAQSHYIYGASECALIAHTSIEYYLREEFALAHLARGVEISVCNPDASGVGRICVTGSTVLTGGEFLSGDLGYLDSRGLHIVGRAAYSAPGIYNYLADERLLSENRKVTRGFSFTLEGSRYVCYQGKLTCTHPDIQYIRFRKLPMDPKHKTKLDYRKVIDRIRSQ